MKISVLSNFAVGHTHLGTSVFAGRPFKKGDVVTQFTGPIINKSELPKKYQGEKDRFVQVGLEEFMGASGGVDDLINHSCDPNTGLRFKSEDILLVAIRDIEEGDEITWDYSTTMLNNTWKMRCDCRNEGCRKIIGDFILLPAALQRHYYKLNIIPPYIKDYMKSREYVLYSKGIGSLRQHAKKT